MMIFYSIFTLVLVMSLSGPAMGKVLTDEERRLADKAGAVPDCTVEDWKTGRVFEKAACRSVFSEASPEERAELQRLFEERQRWHRFYNALPDCTPAERARQDQLVAPHPPGTLPSEPLTCKRGRQPPLVLTGFNFPCTRKWLGDFIVRREQLPAGEKPPEVNDCMIVSPKPYLCDEPARLAMFYMMTDAGWNPSRHQQGYLPSACRETPDGPMVSKIMCEGSSCELAQHDYPYCPEEPLPGHPVRVFRCLHVPGCPPPSPTLEEIRQATTPTGPSEAFMSKLREANRKCQEREREQFLQRQQAP